MKKKKTLKNRDTMWKSEGVARGFERELRGGFYD